MKYKNPSLSVQERVNDLLPRMTLEEKIAQCIQIYIPPDHPAKSLIVSGLSVWVPASWERSAWQVM
jgi:hypothetical protein